jgi:cytochrome d ubiquinol oxidase subunit II
MADLGSLWTTPFALTIGAMAVSLCTTLAAIYLAVEAVNNKDQELEELFRTRGLIAGAVTAVLGALGLALSVSAAPVLWNGMLSHGIPLVIVTMLIGLGAAGTLFFRYYSVSRVLIVVETAFLLGSWGVSQIPYLVPPDITVEQAASPPSTMLLLLVGIIIGLLIIVPSILYLFYIFKFKGGMGLLARAK